MIKYDIIVASSIDELVLKVNDYIKSNTNVITSGGVYVYRDRLDEHFCQSVVILPNALNKKDEIVSNMSITTSGIKKGLFERLFGKKNKKNG